MIHKSMPVEQSKSKREQGRREGQRQTKTAPWEEAKSEFIFWKLLGQATFSRLSLVMMSLIIKNLSFPGKVGGWTNDLWKK
jgi:hypothetical protein